MCFSAEASFGASAVIAVVGIVAIKRANTFPQRIFAIIPLFFAIQQFIEGFLWIVLNNPEYSAWKQPLILGFLFFAWLIWPVYIPFSMAMLEKNVTRRKILFSFLGLGFFVSLGFLYAMVFYNLDAFPSKLNIKYILEPEPSFKVIYGLIYLIPTVVSIMVSSVKKMWILGLINLASYFFSRVFFFGNVLSVWCFFGALASVIILWYIIQMNKISVTDEQNIAQTA